MPTARVLDALHVLVRPPDDCSDGEFLRRFLTDRDEAAFAELVRRHGPLVYGTCRRILGGGAEADDAFQATFFVLARKAGSIRAANTVAGFLYGVAVKVAHKARGQAVKRRVRHMAAARPEAVHPATPTADLWAVLDDELARLPADLRDAVLACDVGGKSRAQAARDLGWPEGTVAKRLAKARETLAKRLTRRGISLSTALTAALAETATAAVPGVLLADPARQATAFAVGRAGSLAVQTLAEGVLRALKVGAVKVWLLVGLLTATLAGGLIPAGGPPAGESRDARKVSTPVPKAVKPAWTDKPPLELPGRLPVSVAYSADGKTTVVGDTDGKVTAFDTASQKKLWETAVGGSHAAVAYAADQKAVYATTTIGVRMLDAATGRFGPRTIDISQTDAIAPTAIDVFTDQTPTREGVRARCAFANSRSNFVASWAADATTGAGPTHISGTDLTPEGQQPADEYSVPVAVDPAGRFVIQTGPRVTNTRKNVVLWASPLDKNDNGGWTSRALEGHTAIVVSAGWSKDGSTAVTGDAGGRVIVWDGKTLKEKHRLELGGRVAALAISADAKRIAAVVIGKTADYLVWDASKKDVPKPIHTDASDFGGKDVFATLTFSPDGKRLAGSAGNRVWLSRLGELVGTVHVWEAAADPKAEPMSWREGKPFADLPGWPVSSLAVSPDGKMLAVVAGNAVSIHDPLTQARLDKGRLGQLKAAATRTAVAFSPSGKLAVTGHNGLALLDHLLDDVPTFVYNGTVAWEGETNFDPHQVAWVKDSADGELLLAANDDQVRVLGWESRNGGPIPVRDPSLSVSGVVGHKPTLVATAPGKRFFDTGQDEPALKPRTPFTVRVTTIEAAHVTRVRMSGHAARPTCGAASADGKTFVSADEAGGLISWDLAAAKPRQQWKLGGTVAAVAVTTDGKTAAVLRAIEAKDTTAWELFIFDPADPPTTLMPTWQTTLPGFYSNPETPIRHPDGTIEGPTFASLAFHPNGTTLFGSLAEPYVRGPKASDSGGKKPTALRVWEK